jgi:hypothetical protein
MTPERRAQIIRESLLNIHRYKLSSAKGVSSFTADATAARSADSSSSRADRSATARPADSFPSAGRASSPPDGASAGVVRYAGTTFNSLPGLP